MAEGDFFEYFKAHAYGKYEDAQILNVDTENLIGIYSYIPAKSKGIEPEKKYVVGFGSILDIKGHKSISCRIEEYGEYDNLDAAKALVKAMKEGQGEG